MSDLRLRSRGFTLIEILVVVSIISILASIGLYNFLEAQTRSKVARALADKRTIVVGLESYRVDHSNYPHSLVYPSREELSPITTPIAYLTSVPPEVFDPHDVLGFKFDEPIYDYVRYVKGVPPDNTLYTGAQFATSPLSHYFLVSVGPDNHQEHLYIWNDIPDYSFIANSYDPTNGSISKGDLYTIGGGGRRE